MQCFADRNLKAHLQYKMPSHVYFKQYILVKNMDHWQITDMHGGKASILNAIAGHFPANILLPYLDSFAVNADLAPCQETVEAAACGRQIHRPA